MPDEPQPTATQATDLLRRSLANGRLGHAYLFAGGTIESLEAHATALARTLNCQSPPATGETGIPLEPCGDCISCRKVDSGNFPDLDFIRPEKKSRIISIEQIRNLTRKVSLKPTEGRYKVAIITGADRMPGPTFNAFLKTLEEPPPRVKFIFATTEVRKIPVTVISRCQRFDLRRVDSEVLASHFTKIATDEGSQLDPQALASIVRAADGSVRDGLSLLDQAINHADGELVTIGLVREMIGLADQARVFDLLEDVLEGKIGPALGQLNEQYQAGAEPLVIVQDLLTITHWLTRLKLEPDLIDLVNPPEVDVVRGKEVARRLSMADLTRLWQMLLKGHGEVQGAVLPMDAAEMLLVRLAFVADMPSPADLVRKLTVPGPSDGDAVKVPLENKTKTDDRAELVPTKKLAPDSVDRSSRPEVGRVPLTFAATVQMFADHGEMRLFTHLQDHVHLVSFGTGKIELRLAESAPNHLASNLAKYLHKWTGQRWVVAISDLAGEPTLSEQKLIQERERKKEAAEHPEVRALLEAFPGAEIRRVRNRRAAASLKLEEDSA